MRSENTHHREEYEKVKEMLFNPGTDWVKKVKTMQVVFEESNNPKLIKLAQWYQLSEWPVDMANIVLDVCTIRYLPGLLRVAEKRFVNMEMDEDEQESFIQFMIESPLQKYDGVRKICKQQNKENGRQ